MNVLLDETNWRKLCRDDRWPLGVWPAAYRHHYQLEDLREALELYKDVIADHPDTQEAGYSRSQIRNIVKAVVPKQAFLHAQIDLASAYLEHRDPSYASPSSSSRLQEEKYGFVETSPRRH